MADRSPMTLKGNQAIVEELHRLKSIERKKASEAIAEARAHGDLKENAEYDAAKEAQGLMEARIRLLELRLSNAQIVDVTRLTGEKVIFGATVLVEDCDNGEQRTMMIVGEEEADIERNRISYLSPIARALIGRRLDDIVRVKLPVGEKEYEIREISFREYED